jgi:very-short-patch-repair endonuclease
MVLGSKILPEPAWNTPLPDPRGADIYPDARLAQARLLLEMESVEWHRFGDAPERTERRRARLAALGWTVLPISPRRLREEPDAVLREIEAAFLAGIARAA